MSTKQSNEALQQQIARLESELSMERAHVRQLQNELDQVSSLKKHVKKFTRKKVRHLDFKVERTLQSARTFQPLMSAVDTARDDALDAVRAFDSDNFDAYNRSTGRSGALAAYRSLKRGAKRLLGDTHERKQ